MPVLRWILALLRTWRGRFIAAFVAVQLLVPLHYYTARKDRHDERFAWRMFSPMRMVACEVRFTLDDQPLELAHEFHEAWIEIAQRGRYIVIEKMAAALCARRKGSAVKVSLSCHYLDGTTEHVGGFDMCHVPEL